jgi:hypothetical protein
MKVTSNKPNACRIRSISINSSKTKKLIKTITITMEIKSKKSAIAK